jgi:urea carboxylase
MQWVQQQNIKGIIDLTPGIRSLQIHFDSTILDQLELLKLLQAAESELPDIENMQVASRTVYLPLAWEDSQTQLATEKYTQLVRPDAPWCPDNIEFIRRINGLESKQAVKDVVYNTSYLVMGLGDVYLGAPVATPLDPRHRLVTTKYNPARTWTPENAVGIGGAYMCVRHGRTGWLSVCWDERHKFGVVIAKILILNKINRGYYDSSIKFDSMKYLNKNC